VDPTATYSHAWGTSPIGAVVNGVMGVTQTAPAWAAFTVKPRLGGVAAAALTLPTLRGPIHVNASAGATAVRAPCGTLALLCAPLPRAGGGGGGGGGALRVLLDGEDVTGRAALSPFHACVEGVGCGAAGAPRVVEVVAA
jgi:hypothetical protein